VYRVHLHTYSDENVVFFAFVAGELLPANFGPRPETLRNSVPVPVVPVSVEAYTNGVIIGFAIGNRVFN
jgi:hypothetical protein